MIMFIIKLLRMSDVPVTVLLITRWYWIVVYQIPGREIIFRFHGSNKSSSTIWEMYDKILMDTGCILYRMLVSRSGT
jgi:hypothetical protein